MQSEDLTSHKYGYDRSRALDKQRVGFTQPGKPLIMQSGKSLAPRNLRALCRLAPLQGQISSVFLPIGYRCPASRTLCWLWPNALAISGASSDPVGHRAPTLSRPQPDRRPYRSNERRGGRGPLCRSQSVGCAPKPRAEWLRPAAARPPH
jgi:hypothetical protein